MPITKITIENFKGIGERVEIPLRPITLLFGANSAGKSTILQALLYLRELLERENADADRMMASGAAIDLGGFRQFIHGHDLQRQVRIGIEFEIDADGLPTYFQSFANPYEKESVVRDGTLTEVRTAGVEVTVEWNHETARPWITGYQVTLNGTKVGMIEAEPEMTAEITWFDYEHSVFYSTDEDGAPAPSAASFAIAPVINELDITGEYGPERKIPLRRKLLPTWGQAFTLPEYDDLAADGENFSLTCFVLSQVFVGTGELALNQLREIRHIGSFRDIPERQFNVRLSPTADRWANGAAAWDLLHHSDLEWFDQKAFAELELGYRIERQSYYEISTESAIGTFLLESQKDDEIYLSDFEGLSVKREIDNLVEKHRVRLVETGREVMVDPCDVGVGVSQVIPVVVGAMAPGCRILSVEQPELHIHPAVQCALADLLAKAVIQSTERCLILETHSEHLMLRWLRRIREGHEGELPPGAPAIKPEHLSVLYVESTPEGQKITRLPITKEGDFARKWPKGFFEERAEELF